MVPAGGGVGRTGETANGRNGETGAALTPDQLRAYCQGQIAHYKIPKYVEIVDALPRTVTGKVRKPDLREMGLDRFGLRDVGDIPTA